MKKYLTLFFLALLTFTSCVREGDIRLTGIEYTGLSSPSKPEITVSIENDSKHKIQIKKAKLAFSKDGDNFLRILLVDKIVIPKCSDIELELPVRVRVSDPLTITPMLSDWRSDPHGITVTGEAVVKAGMGKKKFKFDNMPISQFLSTFGIE